MHWRYMLQGRLQTKDGEIVTRVYHVKTGLWIWVPQADAIRLIAEGKATD